VIHAGDVGTSAEAAISKQGGAHWVADAWGGYGTAKFNIDDVGFEDRANDSYGAMDVEYRTLTPWWILLETHSRLELASYWNMRGTPLGRQLRMNSAGRLANFWTYFAEAYVNDRWFDDRELGNGIALERPSLAGADARVESDPTRQLAFTARLRPVLAGTPGGSFLGEAGLTVRALPQLDLELRQGFTRSRGETRYAGTEWLTNEYMMGTLDAGSMSTMLRATYSFSPRLTLQAYAQLFLAYGHYTEFRTYTAAPEQTSGIAYLGDLRPSTRPYQNPDFESAALNVNAVFRWEWQPGSVLYLVYTRSQVPNVALGPDDVAALDIGALRRAAVADNVFLKLSYWLGN
jgi:hypothetical protein